ncbi:MAG: AmmeMemoRadiSam system radical SAM enzyme [Actinobacteria bacterium]|nr:MAG: AmmeMemoRadiSam system radical SAM enzyme [Actinomycetota bacterium]
MHQAQYYKKVDSKITCLLCPQGCMINPGEVGLCQVRYNNEGKLWALNFGQISSKNLDPIEKKPLYHFKPGSMIYSIGALGCNLACPFCQNWSISQPKSYSTPENPEIMIEEGTSQTSAGEVVEEALNLKAQGNIGIAYTYNEPFMSYEFVLDCSKKAKEAGLVNVMVTNGMVNPKPLEELLPFIDAMNIDLKGIKQEVYDNLAGYLKPVLNTIKKAASLIHIELTNLIVPGLNDKEQDIAGLIDWIIANVGDKVPLHFCRYFPNYQYTQPPTPIKTLKLAEELALERGVKYVYLGNI